jgi:hypothetical protein
VSARSAAEPAPVTHAYVGYNAEGTVIMLYSDDASRDCARECAKIIGGGGRIERMAIEEARKIELYSKPEKP